MSSPPIKNSATDVPNNLHSQTISITREQREILIQQRAVVIWMTGLSGAGKSTIANALEVEMHKSGVLTFILDGDNIRQRINKDLGFSDTDRNENIRRAAEVSKLMLDAGLVVISAFISPFQAEREMAKHLIGDDDFIEVFIDAPLALCEQRDPKGLYQKARNGEIKNMTGIDSSYEVPAQPDIYIDTSNSSVAQAVEVIATKIRNRTRR